MECGVDILYQWVSRMVCIGVYMTGEVPFKDVYLHGMVRAEDGKKMSKSLGNVIDPTAVIEEFGTDAVRMVMVAGRSAGDSAAYAPAKTVAGRNFCNKLWNIARFTESILADKPGKPDAKPISAADHWMLRELQQSTNTLSALVNDYRISEAQETMYHFIWDTLADWYIESSKSEINPDLLRYCLDSVLKLAHPFAPFVTETIWQTLDWTGETLLIAQSWPTHAKYDDKKADQFEEIKTIVGEIRLIKSSLQLRQATLYFTDTEFLRENAELITGLAGIDGVKQVESGEGLHLTQTTYSCWLDVDKETMTRYCYKFQKQLE